MTPRTILFIHQAFPGQFGKLALSLVKDGHTVYALAMKPQSSLNGVTLFKYTPVRQQKQDELPYLLRELDSKVLRGESAQESMRILQKRGINPDVIYAHPGWGEALFVKTVWPKARLVIYAEWFYNIEGQDVNFDKEFPPLSIEEEMRLELKNTVFLHALSQADAAISPTEWQKSRYPAWAQEKIQVIHDGLDIAHIKRTAPRTLKIPGKNATLKIGMPIITFVARHLEPIRGFHTFMRSLPQIFAARPDAHVIVMGQDAGISSGYGKKNAGGTTWRKALYAELEHTVNWSHVHFIGSVPYETYLSLLRISACHVYLTIPFILSWSFLEAALMGLPIVTSATPPVQEFSGLKNLEFVPFDDSLAVSKKIINTLGKQQRFGPDLTFEKQLDVAYTLPKLKEILLSNIACEQATATPEEEHIHILPTTPVRSKPKSPMVAMRRKAKKSPPIR